MSQPVTINEGFVCENCNKPNPRATKSCRNHCLHCLWSKHVDETVPGDRKSECHGLMEPILITYNTQKGSQIIHQCTICKKEMANKIADDDNQEVIIALTQKQNLSSHPNSPKKHG